MTEPTGDSATPKVPHPATSAARGPVLRRHVITRRTRIVLTATAGLTAVSSLTACGSSQADEATASEAASAVESASDSAAANESATDGNAGTGDSGASEDSNYLDGEYSATGHYVSPSGEQAIEVAVTLQGDIVSAVQVTNGAEDPQSEGYQDKFISGIEAEVVGVPIDELAVDKVAGSSLTSAGFNDAMSQIMAEAAA